MAFLLTTEEQICGIKQKLSPREKIELRMLAEDYVKEGPFSVTYHKSPAISDDIHDYFSEGPYWWPDPENHGGPYIRRDGEHNPNRFMYHEDQLKTMCKSVLILAQAGYFLDEKKFSDRAFELLDIWFVRTETRMNANLDYGQAIRGVCNGRGIGIIDVRGFVPIIHACAFLENHYDLTALKAWFSEFADWLVNSKNGIEEKHHGNNHSTWYAAILATIALYIDKKEYAEDCFDFYKTTLVPRQTSDKGEMIDELGRTNSFMYSMFNLDAFALVCELAYYQSVDLWNFETENKSIKKAVEFHMPFMDNPFLWKHQQISGKIPDASYAFMLAAKRLGFEDCPRINEKRSEGKYLIRYQDPIGSLRLI